MSRLGVLYGVGVGPGDPGLLTFNAFRILKAVPVIAMPDSGREGDSIALTVVKGALDESIINAKEILKLYLPMTKEAGSLRRARLDAARVIAECLKEGLDVAFITIGDPLFYSTFSYLVPLLKEILPEANVATVSGVTSVTAASAAIGIPLTEADESMAVVPATYGMEEIRNALEHHDTVVLMKINKVIEGVLDLLAEMELTDKAVYIGRASWQGEEIVRNVENLRDGKVDYFSMMIIRKAARA